jgi:hypothetical protein
MSISLPAALQTILQVGGATVETDAQACVSNVSVNYLTKTLNFTVQQGTTTGQAFSVGQFPPLYAFNINLTSGVWTVSGSALTGTLSGTPLANLQATFLSLRNTGETFVVAQGLLPAATVTAWTVV